MNKKKVLSLQDYYPFGQLEPNRNFDAGSYVFGYQGSLKDDGIKGSGNSYTTKFRLLDVQRGQWDTRDKLFKKYPGWSPYAFSQDRVIDGVDLEGKEFFKITDYANAKGQITQTKIQVVSYGKPGHNMNSYDATKDAQIVHRYLHKANGQVVDEGVKTGTTTGKNAFKNQQEHNIALGRDKNGHIIYSKAHVNNGKGIVSQFGHPISKAKAQTINKMSTTVKRGKNGGQYYENKYYHNGSVVGTSHGEDTQTINYKTSGNTNNTNSKSNKNNSDGNTGNSGSGGDSGNNNTQTQKHSSQI